MNVLIIGSGAREHAIANALHRSPQKPKIFCSGSTMNPGIMQMAHGYLKCDLTNAADITAQAKNWEIDLAIVGPELSLQYGIADSLWQATIPTIGPKKNLAQIETSKSFARQLMQKYEIDGSPQFKTFKSIDGIREYIQILGDKNYVVKADGLMSGKGVKVAGDHLHSIDEALTFCKSIFAKKHEVIIEEKLIGQEFSLMCFCDGQCLVPMPIVQDHKRAFLNDEGPNTGGMGSYSDANHLLPFLTTKDGASAFAINQAIIQALTKKMKDSYIGILYGSFIATKEGVKTIEFNARFGDPEAMNVLSILKSDFLDICKAMVCGDLKDKSVRFAKEATVCKYAVPQGYPDDAVSNVPIEIAAVKNKSQLYFASVNAHDGKIYLTGSRAVAYVGIAPNISEAEEIAEKEIRGVGGPLYHREDIGTDYLIQRRIDEMRHLRSS